MQEDSAFLSMISISFNLLISFKALLFGLNFTGIFKTPPCSGGTIPLTISLFITLNCLVSLPVMLLFGSLATADAPPRVDI